jgi:proline dehydrogenase
MLRNLLLKLSDSDLMQHMVTHFDPARRVARRFVAGETLDEAVTVVENLNQRGIKAILNEVGEAVTSKDAAGKAAQDIQTLLYRIDAEGLDSTVSLKPSHVGMTFGSEFFYQNVVGIMQTAQQLGITVEIDMEHSSDVDDTLAVYHRLLDEFGGGIRLAIQSYLHRAPADLQRMIERGAGVRLVKGAYDESDEIALQGKKEIRQATKNQMVEFFAPRARDVGAYLALGSHDPDLIEWLIQQADLQSLDKEKFEIQMLLGVRRAEQQRLADLGYQVRVYVPYGDAWYPYFMRRLAERPANIIFILRAMIGG